MKLRAVAISLLTAVSAWSFAADKDVEAILKTLRDNYQKVKSAKFEVVSVQDRTGGDANPVTSVVDYVAPLNFRIVTTAKSMDGNSLLIIADGKKLYSKTPDGKAATKAFDLDEAGAFINLEGLSFWDYKRQLSTDKGGNMHDSQLRLLKRETWKDVDYMVLEEKAPKSKVFVRYYIDNKTKMIVRTCVYDLEDTANMQGDYRIKKVNLGAKIDPATVKVPAK